MRQVNTSPTYEKHLWASPTPQTSSADRILATLIFGGILSFAVFSVIYAWHAQSVFNRMSPAEHLREAKANSLFPALVFSHLAAIPSDAPQYKEVPALLQAAKEVEREDQLRHERNEAEGAKEQYDSEAERLKKDANLSSYWPTTVRVDTDMDSFWLNAEERTCITTSGAEGRVAAVTCDDSGSHQAHNIPVKFWGGVDRNVGSSWRCRREGDDFVCRAID